MFRVGVANAHPRQQAELDALPGQGEHPRDERLTGDDRGEDRQDHQRQGPALRCEREEGVGRHRRIRPKQGRLPQVAQHQRRSDEHRPGQPDRPGAEVTHVGIQGLGAGHGQDHRARQGQGLDGVVHDERDRIVGGQRDEDTRLRQRVPQAEPTDDDEPQDHDRAEEQADRVRPAVLKGEEHDEDDHRQRHGILPETGPDLLQALGGRQHGDGRRQHAIAEQQRGAHQDQPEQPDLPTARRLSDPSGQQREQAEDPALAMVVGPHHDEQVLHRDHGHERPEDQGDDPEELSLASRALGDRLLQRVEGTGSDVPEHDARGADRQG